MAHFDAGHIQSARERREDHGQAEPLVERAKPFVPEHGRGSMGGAPVARERRVGALGHHPRFYDQCRHNHCFRDTPSDAANDGLSRLLSSLLGAAGAMAVLLPRRQAWVGSLNGLGLERILRAGRARIPVFWQRNLMGSLSRAR